MVVVVVGGKGLVRMIVAIMVVVIRACRIVSGCVNCSGLWVDR